MTLRVKEEGWKFMKKTILMMFLMCIGLFISSCGKRQEHFQEEILTSEEVVTNEEILIEADETEIQEESLLSYTFTEEEIEMAKQTIYKYFEEGGSGITISNLRFDKDMYLWDAPHMLEQHELQDGQLLILKGDADDVWLRDDPVLNEKDGRREDWGFTLRRNDKDSEWIYVTHGY